MHAPHTADAATVTACGDIDLATAPELRRSLVAALHAHRDVVLDLSQVTFMNCAGLAALVHARNLADRLGAHLVLRGVGRDLKRLFRLTSLHRHLLPGSCPPVPPRKGDTT
ncbi:STAS domain-containing protein [Kitasatospora sp. NPDC059146]|uniref:STAS domain-containing protein n=1 Tax=unclassified Kitasatospora TaxID=2633591 RepID=UPI0036961AF8